MREVWRHVGHCLRLERGGERRRWGGSERLLDRGTTYKLEGRVRRNIRRCVCVRRGRARGVGHGGGERGSGHKKEPLCGDGRQRCFGVYKPLAQNKWSPHLFSRACLRMRASAAKRPSSFKDWSGSSSGPSLIILRTPRSDTIIPKAAELTGKAPDPRDAARAPAAAAPRWSTPANIFADSPLKSSAKWHTNPPLRFGSPSFLPKTTFSYARFT